MTPTDPLPASRVAWILRPFHRFFEMEAAGGIVLLACAAAALVWANVEPEHYREFWGQYVAIGPVDSPLLKYSLGHWVNDGLMVIFFLLVGLEIKREVLIGELSSIKQAALPIAAAIGGMVVPATIYAVINRGGEGLAGWGVPMATDIAFAVGVLALAGRRAPLSLKVFLLAVAIVDDLGAVMVIALFYTAQISTQALAAAVVVTACLIALNLLGVHRPLPYVLLGVALWLATLLSGVHATIAGVVLAMTIPARRRIDEPSFLAYSQSMLALFERDVAKSPNVLSEDQETAVHALEQACEAVQTPLARVEHALLWPVSFLIVPLFALANAGVHVGGGVGEALTSPVAMGAMLGLIVGKPVGVLLFSFAAVSSGVARLPASVSWRQLAAVSCLCGIGFTMSLFIAILAFPERPELLDQAKLGVLVASALMGAVGLTLLFMQPATQRSASA